MTLNQEELDKILDDLKENKISELYLSKGDITSDQAIEIAKALKSNTSLIYLNLSSNKIGIEGGKALANYLKRVCKRTSIIPCQLKN